MNLTVSDFRAMSTGRHNLGSLTLDNAGNLQKVNNHAHIKSLNNVQMSKKEVQLVKNAFITALKNEGLNQEQLAAVRERLGLDNDGELINQSADVGKFEFKPLDRKEVSEILNKYNSTFNGKGGIDDFNKLSRGTYNAGEFTLDKSGNLAIVNNHISMTWKNNVSISPETVLRTKEQFLESLKNKGLDDDQIGDIRHRLGLSPRQGLNDLEALAGLKPLTRIEVREILNDYAKSFNGVENENKEKYTYKTQDEYNQLFGQLKDAKNISTLGGDFTKLATVMSWKENADKANAVNSQTMQSRVNDLRAQAKAIFNSRNESTNPDALRLKAATIYLMMKNPGTASATDIAKFAETCINELYTENSNEDYVNQSLKFNIDQVYEGLKDPKRTFDSLFTVSGSIANNYNFAEPVDGNMSEIE